MLHKEIASSILIAIEMEEFHISWVDATNQRARIAKKREWFIFLSNHGEIPKVVYNPRFTRKIPTTCTLN
jgi:hypothetical protein